MDRYNRPIYLGFCLLLTLLGCSSQPEIKKNPPSAVVSPALKVDKKEGRAEEEKKFIEAIFGPLEEMNSTEEGLQIRVSQERNFLEDEFAQLMVALGSKLPEKIPSIKNIFIKAKGPHGANLSAVYLASDALQFARGEISKPEWVRRTQITIEETPESMTVAAREKLANGELALAIPLLQQILEAQPQNNRVRAALGNALRDTHQENLALEFYNYLLNQPGFEFFALWNSAYCQEILGQLDEAIAFYGRALALDPGHPLLLRQLSVAHLKKGQTAQAKDWLLKYKSKESGEMSDWIEALILRQQKKFKEARDLMNKVGSDFSGGGRVLFDQILLDLDTKNTTTAKNKFTELKKVAPQLAQEISVVSALNE